MAKPRKETVSGIGVLLIGLALAGCTSTPQAKVHERAEPTPPTSVAAEKNPETAPQPPPPRPRPYFGPPPTDYDPLSGTHENLFDPLSLGQPQICCPIHGLNSPKPY
ncbi:MAG: hypothetical protein SynsKO_24630 [Synoicihabitans sp.]